MKRRDHSPQKYLALPMRLGEKLSGLRRGLVRCRAERIFWPLLCFAGLWLFASALADRIWGLDPGGRFAGFLPILAGISGAFLGTFLVVLKPPSNREMARFVEQRSPELEGRLLSVIELAEREACGEEDPNISRSLTHAFAAETDEVAAPCSFISGLPRKSVLVSRVSFLAPLLLLGGAFLLQPDPIGNAVVRVLLPMAPIDRYTLTRIQVIPGDTIVAISDSLDIEVRTWGDTPRNLEIQYRPAESGTTDFVPWQSIHIPDAEGIGIFRHTFSDIRREFEYQVRAGDGEAGPFIVRAVARPKPARIDVGYEYPAYTHLEPVFRTGVEGSVRGVPGTRVSILVETTSHATMARYHIGKEDWIPVRTEPVERGGSTTSFHFTIHENTHYEVSFRDPFGWTDPAHLRREIRSDSDSPPALHIVSPENGVTVMPDAIVDLIYEAEDDFGIVDLSLIHHVSGGTEAAISLPVATSATRSVRRIADTYSWDLSGMNLKKGDVLEFYLQGKDNLPESPQSARSPIHRLFIVSRLDDLDGLVSLERDILHRMRTLEETHRNLADRLTETLRELNDNPQSPVSTIPNLTSIRDGHSASRMEALGLSDTLESLQRAVERHPYVDGHTISQLGMLGREMRALAREDMPRASAYLDEAIRNARESSPPPTEQRGTAEGDLATGAQPEQSATPEPFASIEEAQREQEDTRDALARMRERLEGLLRGQELTALASALTELADRQEEMRNRLQEMLPVTAGIPVGELKESARRDLDRVARQAQESAKRAEELSERLGETARQMAYESSSRSGTVDGARQLLEELPELMNAIEEDITQNRLFNASSGCTGACARLASAAGALRDAARDESAGPRGMNPEIGTLAEELRNLEERQRGLHQEARNITPDMQRQVTRLAAGQEMLNAYANSLEAPLARCSGGSPRTNARAASNLTEGSRLMHQAERAFREGDPELARLRQEQAIEALARSAEALERSAEIEALLQEFASLHETLKTVERIEERQREIREGSERAAARTEPDSPAPYDFGPLANRQHDLARETGRTADRFPGPGTQTDGISSSAQNGQALREAAQAMREAGEGLRSETLIPGIPEAQDRALQELKSSRENLSERLAATVRSLDIPRGLTPHPGTFFPGAWPGVGFEAPPLGRSPETGSDAWAELPPRLLEELERGNEELFPAEFTELLRLYFRSLSAYRNP